MALEWITSVMNNLISVAIEISTDSTDQSACGKSSTEMKDFMSS
jgi:hypothetical protein